MPELPLERTLNRRTASEAPCAVGLASRLLPLTGDLSRRRSPSAVDSASATSDQSFEDAINQGVNRATSTLCNVESAWIKDMNVIIENGNIAGYKVNMAITFVLEEGEQPG